ncbi:MAG TPA: glycine oxidase ThiO [Longimicrobiales bacterium]
MKGRTTDVAIVGGGVIGCALAWELARRGVDVTVVERGVPGHGASRAAGGMLAPVAEADEPGPFLRLATASLGRWPAFVEAVREASGVPVEYRAAGKLCVALDDDGAAALEAAYRWQRAAGHTVDWLNAADARALEPALSEAVQAATLVAADHWVDNRRLGRALWVAAARAGARVRTGAAAVALLRGPGPAGSTGVIGVALDDGGRVDAGAVVVAAGCWSGLLAGLPRPLPVIPVRGQMAAVRTVPPALGRTVMAGHTYLIPRGDGRIIIGATSERVGFRAHTTPAGIASLLTAALRVVPSLADAPLTETWAGLRPGTPDGGPILGPDPEIPGLFYATGHFRNGILLTPITAALLADAVTGEPTSLPLDAFAPDRFAEVTA